MDKKLSWEEIKQLYDQEWVELINYDWSEEEIDPRAGVVRIHAKNREEFDELVGKDPPYDSAYVYVGEPEVPANKIFNTFRSITVKPNA